MTRRRSPCRVGASFLVWPSSLSCTFVTRYRFSNGARYVLLASPVLILAFYHALLSLFQRQITRLIYLAVCATLVFLSNFRTLDVVSRSFFGTFAFGSHAMLDMTSMTGGLMLDSIVYNPKLRPHAESVACRAIFRSDR